MILRAVILLFLAIVGGVTRLRADLAAEQVLQHPAETAQHVAQIVWSPVTSSGVVTYNLYRSDESRGPFIRVGNGINTTAFVDSSISAGHTYYDVVTAVDQRGRESRFSGETSVAVPLP